MVAVFLEILNMSISASWLILAVVLFRLLLKRAPRWITVFLWGIVALRLVTPFSFESALSLIPSAQTIPEEILSSNTFNVNTGLAPIDSQVNSYLDSRYYEGVTVPANNGVNVMMVLSAIWGIGAALLLVYAAVSYLRVRWSVEESVPYLGNIFLCDHVKSPFILGLFRPKIYLPSGMDAAAIGPVTAHEKAHLARRDHWWKPLGFLILTIHWFNLLCWAAYVLFCRDIELACDEKVIRQLDLEGKKQYSTALLECSMGRRLVTICPLAFGEVGVKERVKKVLNYKKPAFWLIAMAVIACGVVAVCFATNPVFTENYICLKSTHSTPPAAFYSLNFAEKELQGTVIAERWENGRCISTNPVFMNNLTQQIQLYLEPQENGVNVQLGIDNGDTILENFSYPEGEQPVGWSFVSLEEGKKELFQSGTNQIIAAMALDFGEGAGSYSCESLSADQKQMENAPYLIVIRAYWGNSSDPIDETTQTPSTVQAQIVEIEDGSLLVAPAEGAWELSSSDLFRVPITNMPSSPEPQVGDLLEITYDGYILEIYPAQFGKIYSTRVIRSTDSAGSVGSTASLVKQIEGAEHAVDPVLAEAFLGRSQEEAINLLGLTEENRDSSALGGSPGEAYNAAYSLCGMELNTTLFFGMDLFGSFAAETTLDDSDEARTAAATCVQLFREQFLDYGYTKGSVSEGKIQDGTSFSYEEGVEKDLLQEFWAAEDGVYLTFRFYLNEEKNAHEYVELRIAKSDTTPGKINLHFEGARALAYFI